MFATPTARAKDGTSKGKAGRSSSPIRKDAEPPRLVREQAASWDFAKVALASPGHEAGRPPQTRRTPLPSMPSAMGRGLQKKSSAGPVADPWEQEADRLADQIANTNETRQPDHSGVSTREASPPLQPSAPALSAAQLGSPELPAPVRQALQSSGELLDRPTQRFMESRFHHDFSSVRIHADPRSAQSAAQVQAHAYTVGPHVAFAAGRYRPGNAEGSRLLAHELTHVVQQGAASPLRQPPGARAPGPTSMLRSEVRLARAPASSTAQSSMELDRYDSPEGQTYRVGDAAGMRLLMEIGQEDEKVTFRVFNFEAGSTEEMGADQWAQWVALAQFSGTHELSAVGSQLSPLEWRSLWPDPVPELMRRYEAGKLSLSDPAVLSTYRGMVRSDARRILNQNERALDELLNAPNRLARLQEYADGLREASQIRDAIILRKNEIAHSLVVQHSPNFGLFHAGTGPDMVQNLQLHQALAEVEGTLATWYAAFPLLTRLKTPDISAEAVEKRLLSIKGNISGARKDLESGDLEPMKMDNVRAGLASKLGPKATGVVAAEDKSNARWALAGAIGLTALTIALLFIPGGAFIDAAIGIAMAASAISDAQVLGRAANTGMHVDDGLVSQEAALGAAFGAVLATVFAIVGTAAAGFRVLRVGKALVGVSRSMPELALAERAAVARAIANDAKLVSTLSGVAKDDLAISARVGAAVRRSAGNMGALRTSLNDIAQIAAIPRRAAVAADAYEPLRQIVDGSDIQQISKATGFSRAEVEAAKRNLMLDEHILVDDTTGQLYRARFTAIESDAKAWARVARGEAIGEADRTALAQLIRHEAAEAAVLGGEQQTLENLFLRGKLEERLRTFLQSKGQNSTQIDALLANEPRPVTPYRYAHWFAHYTTGPNPGSLAAGRMPLPKVTP